MIFLTAIVKMCSIFCLLWDVSGEIASAHFQAFHLFDKTKNEEKT